MRHRRHGLWYFMAGLALAVVPGWPSRSFQPAPQAAMSPVDHSPISEYSSGAPLVFRAGVAAPAAWVSVFYRFEGIDHFQARPMEKTAEGAYVLEFDPSLLPAGAFDYYLAADVGSGIVTLPEAGQEQPFHVVCRDGAAPPGVPADLPTPQEEAASAEAASIPFPIQVSGSGQAVLTEKTPVPGADKLPASGNVRIFFSPPRRGAFGLNFDSNFSYSSTPLAGEKPVDLSNMNASLSLTAHTLRAGDLTVQESEYSVQGLGRRGLEYAFDNQKAYVHLFTLSSQQARGFKGFGLPRPEVAVFGGAAGFRVLGEAIFLKAIYLAGRDNPSAGMNIAVPEGFPGSAGRQGRVLALVEETRLWSGRLGFRAEFARCRHDEDLEDAQEPLEADALTLGTSLTAGAVSASATYRRVGKGFRSIGLQALADDRSGLEATVGLALGPASLTGAFLSQSDNLEEDPNSATTSSRDGNVSLSLALSPKAQIAFGYRLGRQKTEPGATGSPSQDSATNDMSGSFNLIIGSTSSVAVSVVSSRLSSEANPETDCSTFTLNLGGTHNSEHLVFTPSLGLTTTKSAQGAGRATTLSAMVAAEYFFRPQAFSAVLTGSLSRTGPAEGLPSRVIDLLGGLNIYLGKILKFGSLLLALKGSYNSSLSAGLETANWRVFAQCDLAF